MRSGGETELSHVPITMKQLQDIKEEEDVELTRLNSHASSESRGSMGDQESEKVSFDGDVTTEEVEKEITVVASASRSRDDLSLLPPLPNTIDRVNDQDDDKMDESSLVNETQAPASQSTGQFDLSKALEIPVSFGGNANGETSTINHTGSHSDSSLSLTPLITSPKLSLKKKFASVTPEGSPSETDGRSHSIRNRSNSNVTAFQHILPKLNMAIDASSFDHHHHHHHHHYQARVSVDKRSTRKFSSGDSSSLCTSNNSVSETELLYKIPPPMLNGQSRSRSCSNPLNNVEGLNTPSSSIQENDSSPKKVPLLRRASSAILRKTSLRGSKEFSRSSSTSATPVLQSRSVFESELPMRTACRGSRSLLDGASSIINNVESEDELLYVTPLNGKQDVSCRSPSIRSRVRRGFSRIMSSGGSIRRSSSADNTRSLAEQQQDYAEQKSSLALQLSTTVSNGRFDRGANGSSQTSSPTEAFKRENTALVTPISTSTVMTPMTSRAFNLNETTDQKFLGMANGNIANLSNGIRDYNTGGNSKVTTNNGWVDNTVNQKVNRGDENPDVEGIIENDVTVDLDKLTKAIPIITVTDKLSSKDSTSVQFQSNIILDEVYRGKNYKNDKRLVGGTPDKHDESNKPEMMTLGEYTNVLMRQQQVEDERFAALEKNFRDSGWCSNAELTNLKQKRIIINKKWAERISFYQNKLDS